MLVVYLVHQWEPGSPLQAGEQAYQQYGGAGETRGQVRGRVLQVQVEPKGNYQFWFCKFLLN